MCFVQKYPKPLKPYTIINNNCVYKLACDFAQVCLQHICVSNNQDPQQICKYQHPQFCLKYTTYLKKLWTKGGEIVYIYE